MTSECVPFRILSQSDGFSKTATILKNGKANQRSNGRREQSFIGRKGGEGGKREGRGGEKGRKVNNLLKLKNPAENRRREPVMCSTLGAIKITTL